MRLPSVLGLLGGALSKPFWILLPATATSMNSSASTARPKPTPTSLVSGSIVAAVQKCGRMIHLAGDLSLNS